jgi:hypothetical protein
MAKMGSNSGGNGARFSYIFCHVPAELEEKYAKRAQFLTAILHRGLRNDVFSTSLLFPYSFWTFIPL